MDRQTPKCAGLVALLALGLTLAGCQSSVAPATPAAGAAPAYNAWTTPPAPGTMYAAAPAQAAALQPAPQSIPAPTAYTAPRLERYPSAGLPPPPPPPDGSMPVAGAPTMGNYY
ncbi:MAG: hypothetical protein O2894_04395 [Planctomycetota bacterium]|nr:hypothetical protein [Planctomycetota bacterium]